MGLRSNIGARPETWVLRASGGVRFKRCPRVRRFVGPPCARYQVGRRMWCNDWADSALQLKQADGDHSLVEDDSRAYSARFPCMAG